MSSTPQSPEVRNSSKPYCEGKKSGMMKSITSTRMMTRRVVISDNFLPTRVSAFGFGGGFSGLSACRPSVALTCLVTSPSSSSSSKRSSSSPSPGGAARSVLPRLVLQRPSFCSNAVLYVLYNFTSRSNRMMRTVRAALAPALPARLVRKAPVLSASVSTLQAISFQTQVRSKIKVIVDPTSRRKKKPKKYSSLPRDAATISVEKTNKQHTVKTLNKLSNACCVAARRKSSPTNA
mmetsp:Transcript_25179/g.72572  ORF Transcript_25179/g.72572 Transcript_25179/m.72572 type:complete len:235 (-) Transcript_25179:135-839(-)